MQFVILFLTLALVDAQDSKPDRLSAISTMQAAVAPDGEINMHDMKDGAALSPKTKLVARLAEKHNAAQLAKVIQMTLGLAEKMKPLRKNLAIAFNKAEKGPAKEHLKELLDHIAALNDYSKQTAGLVADLQATQNGTQDEKETAMLHLLEGVKSFSDGIKIHLHALEELKPGHEEEHVLRSNVPLVHSGKIQKVLSIMETEMEKELKNPRYATDKEFKKHVQTDMLTYVLTKNAVDESDKVITAAAKQLLKNPTGEVKEAVATMVKDKLSVIKQKLNANLQTLKTAVDIYAMKEETGEVPEFRKTLAAETAEEPKEERKAEEETEKPKKLSVQKAEEPTKEADVASS